MGTKKTVKKIQEKGSEKAPIGVEAPKAEKKTAKGAQAEADPVAAANPDMPAVDPDEIEEQQDAAAAASSESSSAAALAAAASPTEASASFKNFRHHPDMENFYRFIYENDLRQEALTIIDDITREKQTRKLVKSAKAQAH